MQKGERYQQSKYRMPAEYRARLFVRLPGKVEAAKIAGAWRLFERYASDAHTTLTKETFELRMGDRRDSAGRKHELRQIAAWAKVQYGFEEPSDLDWEVEEGSGTKGNGPYWERLLALVEEAEPHLGGPDRAWMELIDREQANVQAAFQGADPLSRLRIVAALRRYWYARGRFQEGREQTEAALEGCAEAGEARAKALVGLAAFLCVEADFARVREAARASLAISERDMPAVAAEAHSALGVAAHHEGDLAEAENEFRTSHDLYKASGAPEWLTVNAANNLGVVLVEGEKFAEAEQRLFATEETAGRIDHKHGRFVALTNLISALMYQGKWKRALLVAEHGLRLQPEGSRPWTYLLVNLGITRAELDRFGESAENFVEALSALREMNDRRAIGTVVGEIGTLRCRSGDVAHAVQLWQSALRIRDEYRCPLPKSEQRRLDAYVVKAREVLGAEEYDDQAYAGGRIIESDAVELAIDLCHDLIGAQ